MWTRGGLIEAPPPTLNDAMTSRERVLTHLEGGAVERLPLMPITMMFAADLAGVSYRDYCTDYRVLAEGQLRVCEEFDFDYVNTMSDPAREAADCGAAVEYFEDTPVAFREDRALLSDKSSLAALRVPDPLGGGRMHNGVRAVELLRQRVGQDKIVEGWIEGPMAEAADLRGINTIMLDLHDDPQFVRDLFEFVVEMELKFALAQIAAGADVIGIGDAAASLVGPKFYEQLVWPYESRLVNGVQAAGAKVRLHICGNTRFALEGMARLGCEIIDLDFLTPVDEGRAKMGPDQVILGNLNPVVVLRNGSPDEVTAAVRVCHQQAGSRFIVGAGCEVPRDTSHENLRAMCRYALGHQP
jgi:MtaA/CmuA family methyltransferase